MNERSIRSIVSKWQKILSLDNWQIAVDFEGECLEANARIWISGDYDRARITIEPKWREWDPQMANETMVHELLHCTMRDMDFVFDCMLDGQMHRDVLESAIRTYRHAQERLIDNMSQVMVAMSE